MMEEDGVLRPELNGGETWKELASDSGRVTYRADFIAEGMSESISVEFTAIVVIPSTSP